jgi:hypothetical protein
MRFAFQPQTKRVERELIGTSDIIWQIIIRVIEQRKG